MSDEQHTDPYALLPGESVGEFAERMKQLQKGPSWAELRGRTDHADKAYEFLSSAAFNGDAQMARVMVDAATVHATLALTDKVEELIATLKLTIGNAIDTHAELSETVKTATKAVVVELRKATVKAADTPANGVEAA